MMINEEQYIKTKFGTAKKNKDGYYIITSTKEGNHGKLLHRLVWEDWYNKLVPAGYVIHHLNGDKLDNRIQNLQCVTREAHTRFHRKGKKCSDETRKKMSEAKKGRTLSEETRKKMAEAKKGENNPMYDKHHSVETRKKLSEANKGENNPMYNKHHSVESRKKISEANIKPYARVINQGKTSNGKQIYALKHKSKIIKYSIHKKKLEKLAEKINKEEDEMLEKINEQQVTIERLKEIAKRTEEEKEYYADLYNKCRRLQLSDEAIKQAYANLNRREREKHSQGNATYISKINKKEVIY